MLRAMATAPRDGTMFVALPADLSGIMPLYFDAAANMWRFSEGDCYSNDEASWFDGLAGWFEMPEDAQLLLRTAWA